MNIKNLFTLFILFVLPGNNELLLEFENNAGNMGLYGVYLDIYYKRNLYYLSIILLIVSYFYNFILCGFLFHMISLYLFLSKINEWKIIILNNIKLN